MIEPNDYSYIQYLLGYLNASVFSDSRKVSGSRAGHSAGIGRIHR